MWFTIDTINEVSEIQCVSKLDQYIIIKIKENY